MQPFNGIFHYSVDRDRAGAEARQLGERVRLWKRQVLADVAPQKLTIVTPSRWLGQQSKASEVLGRFPRRVIPYGLNTDVFRPWPRPIARQLFGLPQDCWLLLSVLMITERGWICLLRHLRRPGCCLAGKW